MSTLYVPEQPYHNVLTITKAHLYVEAYLIRKLLIKRCKISTDVICTCAIFLTENHVITYKSTLYSLFNNNFCIGVYDFINKQWRTAIYIKHWQQSKKIAIRYLDTYVNSHLPIANFHIIENFPVNYVIQDWKIPSYGFPIELSNLPKIQLSNIC